MKKMMNFKKWLTVPDTAAHLSIVLGDTVSEADVLRLALDGHLKLSLYFVNRTFGRRCHKLAQDEKIVGTDLVSADGVVIVSGYYEAWGDAHGSFVCERALPELDSGVFELNLSMAGGRTEVQRAYHLRTGGPQVVKHPDEGEWSDQSIFVTANGGEMYKIQARIEDADVREPFHHGDNFSPAPRLPSHTVLVVQTKHLQEFEQAGNSDVKSPQNDKPLASRERTTLLVVVAAACKAAGIEMNDRSAASTVVSLARKLGATISDDSVRRVFKQIPDALGARTK